MKNRMLAFVLSLLLFLSPLMTVTATEPGDAPSDYGDVGAGYWEDVYGEAYARIRDALLEGAEKIPLSEFGLSPSELATVYETLYYTEAELFVISSSYSYTSTPGGDVSALIPTYRYGAGELAAALSDFRARTDAILSEMPTGLSPLERLIFLYDYLATHFVYEADNANYDAYGMLIEGNGVCQAYSLLLRYLLRAVGVPAECVTSNALNHEWNLVKLGDAWYHVDVTWDDDDDDGELGQVDHKYFLLSDAAFMAGEHYATDWISPTAASDTRYDGVFESVSSRFVFDGAERIYAVKDSYICLFDGESDFLPLKKINAVRYTGGGQIWSDLFAGLALLGGKLLYNTESEIRLYDPQTKSDTRLLAYATTTRSYLYGFSLDETSGTVSCSFKSGANDKGYSVDTQRIAFTVTFSILGAEYSELYFYGDIPTCKESTDVSDDRYRFTFLGWDRPISPVRGDVVYTAQYEVTQLFSESAKELLACVSTASDPSSSLYARYTALTRALAIKDAVDRDYAGVADAIAALDALVSLYDEDAETFGNVFSGWVPVH